MKNISIQIDENLFRIFSVACAELGLQKKSLILTFIKNFLEQEEDRKILKLAAKRLERFEKTKPKTIGHKDAWK